MGFFEPHAGYGELLGQSVVAGVAERFNRFTARLRLKRAAHAFSRAAQKAPHALETKRRHGKLEKAVIRAGVYHVGFQNARTIYSAALKAAPLFNDGCCDNVSHKIDHLDNRYRSGANYGRIALKHSVFA